MWRWDRRKYHYPCQLIAKYPDSYFLQCSELTFFFMLSSMESKCYNRRITTYFLFRLTSVKCYKWTRKPHMYALRTYFYNLRALANRLARLFGHPTQVCAQVQLATTYDRVVLLNMFPVAIHRRSRKRRLTNFPINCSTNG